MEAQSNRGLFVIHCIDDLSGELVEGSGGRSGGSAKRLALYPQHKAYVSMCNDPSSPLYIKKVCGGPLESDDGGLVVGSLFIVEGSKAEVERFHRNDPFYVNGVWEKVTISRYTSPSGIKAVKAEHGNPTSLRMVVEDPVLPMS